MTHALHNLTITYVQTYIYIVSNMYNLNLCFLRVNTNNICCLQCYMPTVLPLRVASVYIVVLSCYAICEHICNQLPSAMRHALLHTVSSLDRNLHMHFCMQPNINAARTRSTKQTSAVGNAHHVFEPSAGHGYCGFSTGPWVATFARLLWKRAVRNVLASTHARASACSCLGSAT